MTLMSFCDALNEAMYNEMKRDTNVFVYGIGVPDHVKIFGSTKRLLEEFGENRCFDTPVSEDAMTGFGLGAAINGLRPIHIHIRVDFLLLAMNQLANMVSSYCYGSGGKLKVPMVIRAVVGRGWGQAYQHSKSLFSCFAHIPGLKVVLPTTPRDAKGLLTAAIRDDNPVVFLEHRWLYWQEGEIPDGDYVQSLEQGEVIRVGSDCTVVALSWMNVEATHAAKCLKKYHGLNIEIVDPKVIAPLNDDIIINSVNKTGYCLVADNDWVDYGASAEIAARVSNKCFSKLKAPVERIGFAHTPCPTVRHLENEFYPNALTIIRKIESLFGLQQCDLSGENFYSHENRFKGPF